MVSKRMMMLARQQSSLPHLSSNIHKRQMPAYGTKYHASFFIRLANATFCSMNLLLTARKSKDYGDVTLNQLLTISKSNTKSSA